MSTPQPTEPIPAQAQPWLRSVLGEYHVLSAHRIGSPRTGVWKLSSRGDNFFFKLHHHRLLWSSEVAAYRQPASAYQSFVPHLIAVFDEGERQGLLVTAMTGVPLRECHFDETTVNEVYRQAGRLCKHFHDQPAGTRFGLLNEHGVLVNYQGESMGERATDAVAFVGDSLVELLNQAQAVNALEAAERGQIEQALAAIESFRQEAPTMVNADYTPNNWLVDQDGKFVGIIDLEHVYRNVMVDAFTRLLVENFPPGAKAFFEGYGSNPLATRLMQARIICLRHALYYVTYGVKRQNASWLQRGKQVFRQLKDLLAIAEV